MHPAKGERNYSSCSGFSIERYATFPALMNLCLMQSLTAAQNAANLVEPTFDSAP
jgi:hypothetical protein